VKYVKAKVSTVINLRLFHNSLQRMIMLCVHWPQQYGCHALLIDMDCKLIVG